MEILKKEFNDEKDILKFYKRNLVPLVVTYEIWNVIYTIFIFTHHSSPPFNL